MEGGSGGLSAPPQTVTFQAEALPPAVPRNRRTHRGTRPTAARATAHPPCACRERLSRAAPGQRHEVPRRVQLAGALSHLGHPLSRQEAEEGVRGDLQIPQHQLAPGAALCEHPLDLARRQLGHRDAGRREIERHHERWELEDLPQPGRLPRSSCLSSSLPWSSPFENRAHTTEIQIVCQRENGASAARPPLGARECPTLWRSELKKSSLTTVCGRDR